MFLQAHTTCSHLELDKYTPHALFLYDPFSIYIQVFQAISSLHAFYPKPHFLLNVVDVIFAVETWCLFPRHLLRVIAASSGAPCQAVAVLFACPRQSRHSLVTYCVIFHPLNLRCSLPMQWTVGMDTSFAGMLVTFLSF
jgi:hypothetical protein